MRDRPRERIDRGLRALRADLEELAEDILPDWESLSVAEQDIWLYEWPDKRARAEDLRSAYHAGEMTGEQRTAYEDLRARLRALAPAMNRIDLRVPEELVS